MTDQHNQPPGHCPYIADPDVRLSIERQKVMAEKVDEMHEVLLGNGNPEKGVVVQLAKMKVGMKIISFVGYAALAGVISLAVNAIFS